MNYLVLARKYRPQSFEDLVGQDHIAQTLANAIKQNRVAHAFLFTGLRGVGKTTSARLLAKCMNCMGEDLKTSGPTTTPCQNCPACREISSGLDLDVQEIDGASYNGVDEVRKLQENLHFRPARDRSKIYIVDEVHMLSTAAWNAFLKTLEEPPPHVRFIFATTEAHKVPMTILSRCQRYDFKLISAQTIVKRLSSVLQQENIKAEIQALHLIAREASGSMRDAMSLLDQVIAYAGQELKTEDVSNVLGIAASKLLADLGQALLSGEAKKCIELIHHITEQGYDLVHVARDFLTYLRALVVAKMYENRGSARDVNDASNGDVGDHKLIDLLDVAEEEKIQIQALAAQHSEIDLTRVYHSFSKQYDEVVRSFDVRDAFEMLLVRLSLRPKLFSIDELSARLVDLERRLSQGSSFPAGQKKNEIDRRKEEGLMPPTHPSTYSHDLKHDPRRERQKAGANHVAPLPPEPPEPPKKSQPHLPSHHKRETPSPSPARTSKFSEKKSEEPHPDKLHTGEPNQKGWSDRTSLTHTPPDPFFTENNVKKESHYGQYTTISSTEPESRRQLPQPQESAVNPLIDESKKTDLDELANEFLFREWVDELRKNAPSLASILEHTAVLRFHPSELVLGYIEETFLGSQLQAQGVLESLQTCFRDLLFRHPDKNVSETFKHTQIKFKKLTEDEKKKAFHMADVDAQKKAEEKARVELAAKENQIVKTILGVFEKDGAELLEVKVKPAP